MTTPTQIQHVQENPHGLMNSCFPTTLARLVYDCWLEYARYWPNNTPPPRPPLSVLVEVMNTCFFASLQQEESRRTQFTLVFCRPSELADPAFRFSKFTKIFNLLRFKVPLPFSTGNLVRLAPACEPEKTLILLSHPENKASLSLWGIADVGRDYSVSCTRLSELQIRVIAPGEITIVLHGRHLCTYWRVKRSSGGKPVVTNVFV